MTKAARRLGREDWIEAALGALAAGGIPAVAVEPLAARLGATKGSFYWHFRDRDDLLSGVLAAWEGRNTAEPARRYGAIQDPGVRLRRLFEDAFADDRLRAVDAALAAHAEHPLVAPVLERVTRTRLEFLVRAAREAGLPPGAARLRALQAYGAWLGHLQLRRSAPDLAPKGRELAAYARHVVGTLLAPVPRGVPRP